MKRHFDQTTTLETSLLGKVVLLSVTAGGVGYISLFPGTVGTLVAIPFSLGLNRFADISLWLASITLITAIFCAIGLATSASELLRQKDPGIIVIDEIVGFLLGNFSAPMTMSALLASFLLFRFFDIAKIFPASRLESLLGEAGIVLDDITFALIQLLLTWRII